jgi:NAD(P)-dependent dehydrogenase (short-subunit alcohol dehydrogenase family)
MNEYKNMFNLKDKVVFIAGGAGAIGGEIARAMAVFGASIAIADIKKEVISRSTTSIISDGAKVMGVVIDVTDESSVTSAVAKVEEELGPIGVLVNAAGTHIEQPAHDLSMDAWDTVLDVNLRGAFTLSQTVSRSMISNNKGGSHIHITSVRSNLGIRRGYAAYCASKGGLGILIKQLATEWAEYNIRVNGIAPTFTRTPLVEDYLSDPAFYNALVQRIPLGRVCETRDLAGIAIFLASDASAFITGQNIFVDGGVTATQ